METSIKTENENCHTGNNIVDTMNLFKINKNNQTVFLGSDYQTPKFNVDSNVIDFSNFTNNHLKKLFESKEYTPNKHKNIDKEEIKSINSTKQNSPFIPLDAVRFEKLFNFQKDFISHRIQENNIKETKLHNTNKVISTDDLTISMKRKNTNAYFCNYN